MKNILAFVLITLATVAVAEPVAATANPTNGPVSVGERRRMSIEKAGGFIVKPGSQKGKAVVIDTQNRIARAELEPAVRDFANFTRMRIVYEQAKSDAPEKLLAASGAKFGVIVVDEPETPAVLIALEDGWAKVNVAKMNRNLKTPAAEAKFWASRCRKEVARVLVILCGGSASQFPQNVMDVARLEDIDLAVEGLPVDRMQAAKMFLQANGFSPEIRTTYLRACREGWAPAPTNDVQKAIWKRLHELPTDPIRIKPETKKVKD